MNPDPQLRRFARKLVALSLNEEGRVDEERTSAVLSALSNRRPHERKIILKYYLRMIEREIRATTALVETAGAITEDSQSVLRKSLSEKTGREVTLEVVDEPALVAGTRVRLGDDVFEYSIPSRLNRLLHGVS